MKVFALLNPFHFREHNSCYEGFTVLLNLMGKPSESPYSFLFESQKVAGAGISGVDKENLGNYSAIQCPRLPLIFYHDTHSL